MKEDLKFYVAIFIRRLHYFLAIFILITASAITVARILPAKYESQARLLVESSQIPEELAAPTVQTGAAEELEIIEQRLMTRVNLLDIARSENVFGDTHTLTADTIVTLMNSMTRISRSAGRSKATLMNLSFTSKSGATSARVVNRYVTLILEANAEIRTDRAGGTLEFFEQEVDRLGAELAKQSAKILQFKNNNSGALPDTFEYRLTRQSSLEERLSAVARENTYLLEQKRRLKELFEATGRVGSDTTRMTPEEAELANLQNQLRQALAVYKPEAPKVKLLQAKVAQQEKAVAGLGIGGQYTATPTTLLDIQLADIDARIKLLDDQSGQINVALELVADSIERTPANSITLQGLDRDYQNIQQQYNLSVDRLSKAATGERIELLAKGQRITVLDPPIVPTEPTSPNRSAISIAGIMLGLAAGLGFVAALEFLNNSIRRPADLISGLGITPLATVPYIQTPTEQLYRRGSILAIIAIIAIGIPAALFAIHTYYLPLDLIIDQVASKIGGLI